MTSPVASSGGSSYTLSVEQLARVLSSLRERGYQLVGPRLRGDAIVYDEIASVEDLPRGWTDEQGPGRYRLRRRNDSALFGFAVGPHSWKQFFHVADERLFTLRRSKHGPVLTPEPVAAPKLALVGARACDLAAVAVQDRILRDGPHADERYAARRSNVFVLAVNCTSAADTCFCASMGTGPAVRAAYDLALTELIDAGPQRFLLDVGSAAGGDIVHELALRVAPETDTIEAQARVEDTAQQMRTFDASSVRDVLLEQLEHPHWSAVAERCLACGNCTLVCPTCFCSTTIEVAHVSGETERRRQLDSCFTHEASYLHGGEVRSSIRSRYRQWLTHKLATWFDQFGSSGCVGCGRCVTWCPVGIDLVAEVAKFRESHRLDVTGVDHA
jgi:sulfhydrogenase subunit beta (sulfur reductase)